MSGILLTQQLILLPRFDTTTPSSWTATASSPSAATTSIIPTNTGGLSAVRSGGAAIALNRWLPFTFGTPITGNFEMMATILSGAAGWTGAGVWHGGETIWQLDGLVFASTVAQVRFDIRLKGSTIILATRTYTITFTVS